MMTIPTLDAMAAWDITIESKTVEANETDVMVSIYGSWDREVSQLSVPIIVREITPGAFWTGSLPYDTGGNALNHPFQHNVSWQWNTIYPWALLIEEFRPDIPRQTCPTDGDVGYDGVSPDHFCINASATTSEVAAKQNLAFCTWSFDVAGVAGTFEFDTACFYCGVNSIYLIVSQIPPFDQGPLGTGDVTFHKGVITITACNCGVPGDVDGSGDMPTPLDVVFLVQKVYRSQDALYDYHGLGDCPFENGDVNGDGGTPTPLDVTFLVQKVYKDLDGLCVDRCHGDPGTGYCPGP
jgi:hypothetical protein